MPKKHQDKVISIVNEECARIPDRVSGYRDELLGAIADIVKAERDHALRSTDIQKQVTGICERLGDYATGLDPLKRKGKAKS